MPAPQISYLTDVYFEPGARRHLPEILTGLGIHRPLLVADQGLASAGLLEQIPGVSLERAFLEVDPNPSEANVEAGVERYRALECDGLVAVGGGSPIDCAKAIGVLATHAPPLEQYAYLRGGLGRIGAAKPPLVAVPTTAGTGSEVGRGALITFRSGRKLALLSSRLFPQAAICDPELTVGLPPLLTAATGMDAITHCVETYLSPRWNPVAEAIALDGLSRALGAIETATTWGQDLAARSEMLLAATQGGLTFQKGLGAVHCLSHALGGLAHRRLHHGTLNAILLPHVLAYNAPECSSKLARLAPLLGVPGPREVPGAFTVLAARLGLPASLRDLGAPLEEVVGVAGAAFEDHCGVTNPRALTLESCRELLRAAW